MTDIPVPDGSFYIDDTTFDFWLHENGAWALKGNIGPNGSAGHGVPSPIPDGLYIDIDTASVYQNGILLGSFAGGGSGSGANGWSPIFAVVADGSREVLKVTSWTGGGGSAPASPVYLGANGFVTAIADAIDIRGDIGPTGATGADGTPGADGATGPKGDTGDTGPAGADGATGPKGDTGDTGPAGTAGATGPAGADGAAGATGPKGDTGDTGPAGTAGATGATGSAGADGARGSLFYTGTGAPTTISGQANGDDYLDTATGNVYTLAAGTWTLTGNIKGPTGSTGADGAAGATGPKGDTGAAGATGPAGADGATGPAGTAGATGSAGADGARGSLFYTGTGAPTTISGQANGDDYLDTATGNVYTLTAGTWTLTGNIKGPIGATGADGAAGATGPKGDTGATGSAGAAGATGATGSAGADGARGSLFYTGTGAPTSISGQANGDDYLDTATGNVYSLIAGTWTLTGNIKGPTGATGATGAPGADGARGSLFYTGTGAPTTISGQANADDYLDTATGNVYTLTAGTWTLAGNIKGPTGAAGSGGSGSSVGFSAHKNGVTQGITSTISKFTFTTELYDVGGYYDATNSKWTPPAGLVVVNAGLMLTVGFAANGGIIAIYKNGAMLKQEKLSVTTGTNFLMPGITILDQANGTDFYEVYAVDTVAGNLNVSGATTDSWFSGATVGGAPGATGATGAAGANGTNGQGVPTGGTTGQVLAKNSATNYDTEWIDAPTGGGARSYFGAYMSANQTSSAGGVAIFDTPFLSSGGTYDATNKRWTPPAGAVVLSLISRTTSNAFLTYSIRKNGVAIASGQSGGSVVATANGTDVFDVVWTVTAVVVTGGSGGSVFSGFTL